MSTYRWNVIASTALGALLGAEQVLASLVLYEPFDYPTTAETATPGPARGLSGTEGVSISSQATGGNADGYVNPSNNQKWVPRASTAGASFSVANDAAIEDVDLTVPGLHKPGASHAASYGGLGYTPMLPLGQVFAPSLGGTDVYYSLAFRIDDISNLASTGGIVAGLTNVAANGSLGNPGVAAAAVFIKPDPENSATHYQIGLGKTGAGAAAITNFGGSYAIGATQFVVGRYTMFDNNGVPETALGNNDVATLWINPDPNDFGALIAPSPDRGSGPGGNDPPAANNTIQSFFLRQAGSANGPNVADVIIADELRVGTTWAAVTPPIVIPEPGGLSLIALGGCAALTAGRRSRRR